MAIDMSWYQELVGILTIKTGPGEASFWGSSSVWIRSDQHSSYVHICYRYLEVAHWLQYVQLVAVGDEIISSPVNGQKTATAIAADIWSTLDSQSTPDPEIGTVEWSQVVRDFVVTWRQPSFTAYPSLVMGEMLSLNAVHEGLEISLGRLAQDLLDEYREFTDLQELYYEGLSLVSASRGDESGLVVARVDAVINGVVQETVQGIPVRVAEEMSTQSIVDALHISLTDGLSEALEKSLIDDPDEASSGFGFTCGQ